MYWAVIEGVPIPIFRETHELKNLVTEITWCKNSEELGCIHVTMKNKA